MKNIYQIGGKGKEQPYAAQVDAAEEAEEVELLAHPPAGAPAGSLRVVGQAHD